MTGRYPGYTIRDGRVVVAGTYTRQPRPESSGAALRLRVTEARATEARRRVTEVTEDLADLATRVTALEHPPTPDDITEPEPVTPSTTAATEVRRPPVTTAEADWIVAGWRENGWRE